MLPNDKLALTKNLLNESGNSHDGVLQAFLTVAQSKILNRMYPFGIPEDAIIPSKYDVLQCQIASYLYSKMGAEGEVSHSENGISRTYGSADVPKEMLAEVTPFCGLPSRSKSGGDC